MDFALVSRMGVGMVRMREGDQGCGNEKAGVEGRGVARSAIVLDIPLVRMW